MLTRDDVIALADGFGFPLDLPWSQLSPEQRENVAVAQAYVGFKSINGAPGFLTRCREAYRHRDRPIVRAKRPRLIHRSEQLVPPVEVLEIDDILDVFR